MKVYIYLAICLACAIYREPYRVLYCLPPSVFVSQKGTGRNQEKNNCGRINKCNSRAFLLFYNCICSAFLKSEAIVVRIVCTGDCSMPQLEQAVLHIALYALKAQFPNFVLCPAERHIFCHCLKTQSTSVLFPPCDTRREKERESERKSLDDIPFFIPEC